MRVEGIFEWLGEVLGTIIRYVVEALSGLFGLLAGAGRSFLEGLSRTLGVDLSLLSLAALFVGLFLLVSALRALIRGSFIIALIWLFLGLWLLSWLIH